MFFFGAFSGNLLYVILAISSLAGCSAMVFRSSESTLKELKTNGTSSGHVFYDNQTSEISAGFYSKGIVHADQLFPDEAAVCSSLKPFFEVLYMPRLLTRKSNFLGLAHFSRPPPFTFI